LRLEKLCEYPARKFAHGRAGLFIQRAQCLYLVNVHKKQTRLAAASFRIFSLSFLRRVGRGLRLQQGRLTFGNGNSVGWVARLFVLLCRCGVRT